MSTKDSRIRSLFRLFSFSQLTVLLAVAAPFVPMKKATHIRMVQVGQPLSIRSAAQSPAKIAFEMIHASVGREESVGKRVVYLEAQPIARFIAQETALSQPEVQESGKALIESVRAQAQVASRELSYQAMYDTLSSTEKQRMFLASQANPDLLKEIDLPKSEDLMEEAFQAAKQANPPAQNSGVILSVEDERSYEPAPSASPQKDQSTSGGLRIGGQINIPVGAGIAMLDGHQLEVFWVSQEDARAVGSVDHDFNYTIPISELNGKVIAQLVDRQGAVIARGERKVSAMLSPGQRSKIDIELADRDRFEVAFRGVKGRSDVHVLNGATGEEAVGGPAVNVTFGDWREKSVVGFRTASTGYYPTLRYGRAGEKAELSLMTKTTVLALMDIIDQETLSMNRIRNESLVWGKVLRDGKPVAGVRVELEGLEDEAPLYFNNAFDAFFFPNRELKTTSQNGLFAFSHLPRGLYALKAYQGDQFFGHALVEVDDGTLSPIELQGTRYFSSTDVKAFDAFTGQPVSAQLELQSSSKGLSINGYSQVRLMDNKQLALLQASFQDSEYEPVMSSYFNDDETIFVPAIRRDWLEGLRAEAKVSDRPGSSPIVVFTENEVEEVFLPTEHENYHRIIYFDSQGNPVSQATAGGGFVIFNASEGAQLVVIKEQGKMRASRFVSVTPGWVSTARFQF